MLKQSDDAHKRGRENMHKTLMKANQNAENLHEDEEEEQLAQQIANAASNHEFVPKEAEPAAQVLVTAKDRDVSGADAALLHAPDAKVQKISQQLDKATAQMASPNQMLSAVSPDHESKLKGAQKAANEAKAKYMNAFKEVKQKKEDKQLSAQREKAQAMVSDPRHFDFSSERKFKAEKAARATAVESAHKQAAAAQTALLNKRKHDELMNKDMQIRNDKANEKLAKAKLFKLSRSAITDVKEEEVEVPSEPAQEVPQQNHKDSKVGLESVEDYVESTVEDSTEKARKTSEKQAAMAAHKAQKKASIAEDRLRVVNLEESTLQLKKQHALVMQQKNKLQQQLMAERESHRLEVQKIQANADADEKSHKAAERSASKHEEQIEDSLRKQESDAKMQMENKQEQLKNKQEQLKEQLSSMQENQQQTEAQLEQTKQQMRQKQEDQQDAADTKEQLQLEVVAVKEQLKKQLSKTKADLQQAKNGVKAQLEMKKEEMNDKMSAMKAKASAESAKAQDMIGLKQAQMNDKMSAMKAKASAMKAKAQAMIEQAKQMEAHSKALLEQQKEEEAKAKRAMEAKLAAVKEAEASEDTAAAKVKSEAEHTSAQAPEVHAMKAQLEALKQQLQAQKKQHHQDVHKLQAQKLAAARPVVAVTPSQPKVVVTPKEEPKVLQKAKKVAAEGVAAEKAVNEVADANMVHDEQQAQGAMDDLMRLAGSDDKALDSEVAVEGLLETNLPTNTEMGEDEDLFDVDSLMNEAQAQVHA
jgi:hypothetical protein